MTRRHRFPSPLWTSRSAPGQLGYPGLDADMSPEKVGGQLSGPLLMKIDGHEVWKHGPLFDSAESASGVRDDPGAGADAEGHGVPSHFDDCPCHPRRGQGLATIAIPHVEVHGTGAGRRRLLGGRRDLRRRDRDRGMLFCDRPPFRAASSNTMAPSLLVTTPKATSIGPTRQRGRARFARRRSPSYVDGQVPLAGRNSPNASYEVPPTPKRRSGIVMRLDRIIKGGNVVTPAGTFVGDVGISGEKIAALGANLDPNPGAQGHRRHRPSRHPRRARRPRASRAAVLRHRLGRRLPHRHAGRRARRRHDRHRLRDSLRRRVARPTPPTTG